MSYEGPRTPSELTILVRELQEGQAHMLVRIKRLEQQDPTPIDYESIPSHIHKAARVVSTWFEERSIKGWRLNGCADRKVLEGRGNPNA